MIAKKIILDRSILILENVLKFFVIEKWKFSDHVENKDQISIIHTPQNYPLNL